MTTKIDIEKITKPHEIRRQTNYGWTTHTIKPLNALQRDFLAWAREAFRGVAHQTKWLRMLITTGVNKDYLPDDVKGLAHGLREYGIEEVENLWKQHNKNARWTAAWEWYDNYRHAEIARQKAFKENLAPPPEYSNEVLSLADERGIWSDKLMKAKPGSDEWNEAFSEVKRLNAQLERIGNDGEEPVEPHQIHDAIIEENWDGAIDMINKIKAQG